MRASLVYLLGSIVSHMYSPTAWILSNLPTVALLVGFLLICGYALWLRFRMDEVSKARFALAVVATMASCAVAMMAFMSAPMPIQIINAVFSGVSSLVGTPIKPIASDSGGLLSNVFAFAVTALSLIAIYRFSCTA